MRKEAEDYLKNFILNGPRPEGVDYQPTQEDWDRIPKEHKESMIDMLLGFNSKNELMEKIMIEYNKKHSDISFGMAVKSLIRNNKK